MIIACFVISDDAKALLGIKDLKVWACSLGLLCLTLLSLTWFREHFQEKELCHSSCPKSVASSRIPELWNLRDTLGVSLLWARDFQAGFWVWACGIPGRYQGMCLFWFGVCLFRWCFSFTISLPAHSWVLYFMTSTVVSAGGFGVQQVFCCWWDSQKDLCGIQCWHLQFPSAGERMFEPRAKILCYFCALPCS